MTASDIEERARRIIADYEGQGASPFAGASLLAVGPDTIDEACDLALAGYELARAVLGWPNDGE